MAPGRSVFTWMLQNTPLHWFLCGVFVVFWHEPTTRTLSATHLSLPQAAASDLASGSRAPLEQA